MTSIKFKRGAQSVKARVPKNRCFSLLAFGISLILAQAIPTSSYAAFSQVPLCQINPGKGAQGEAPETFGPGGVAVDRADTLLVGEPASGRLDEFKIATITSASCGEFLGPQVELQAHLTEYEQNLPSPPVLTKNLTPAESLAVEGQTNQIYVTGQNTRTAYAPFVEVFEQDGHLVGQWEHSEFGKEAHVAIDNSVDSVNDPSACGPECFVYVSHSSADPTSPRGDGLAGGIEKFDASGTPVPFTSSSSCVTPSSYVDGNEITGTPTHDSFEFGEPKSIATDANGDIYVVGQSEIYEYGPCGLFKRSFVGSKTPGLAGSTENGGFGGNLTGVAIDPITGVVAVAVSRFSFENPSDDRGAIDEFDSTSGKFINQLNETSQTTPIESADQITFDQTGNLYAVDNVGHTINVFGPGRFVPSYGIANSVVQKSTSVLLTDFINPETSGDPEHPQPGLTECQFEYVAEAAFVKEGFATATATPCSPSASEILGDGETEVRAAVNGLVGGATYYYRLSATIPGMLGGRAESEPFAFTIPAPPRVDSTSAAGISSTFAELQAKIDPLGSDTEYHFEYVSEAEYDTSGYTDAASTPTANIGSGGPTGNMDARVSQQVGGLVPRTTYYFRVIAESEIEDERVQSVGATELFSTLPESSRELPDSRSYEMLTPVNKEGAADMFAVPETGGEDEFRNYDAGYPSDSGNEFLLETDAAFGVFPAMLENVYVFTRDTKLKEWVYNAAAYSVLGVQSTGEPLYDPTSFARLAINDGVGSYASEDGVRFSGLVGPAGGPYEKVYDDSETSHSLGSAHDLMAGASDTLSHIVIESPNSNLNNGRDHQDVGSYALYEWSGGAECTVDSANCELVSVEPSGLAFKCGAMLGQGTYPGTKHSAVSSDGSKIFFTAPDPRMRSDNTRETEGCWDGGTTHSPQVYTRSQGVTTEMSSPQGVTVPAGQTRPAVFVGASDDGTRSFFVTDTELTPDAVTADGSGHVPELYEYDTEAPQGERLTRVSGGTLSTPVEGDVDYVPAVSADGSTVYFTAFGRLSSNVPSLEAGQVYLYRYDTLDDSVRYVATVDAEDYPSDVIEPWWTGTGLPREIALNTDANWYTTANGEYLLFATSRELVPGYQTANDACVLPHKGGYKTGHCDELYRYKYDAGSKPSIICVSCNPSGAAPTSNSLFARSASDGLTGGPPRGMSNDGSYVFFDTADALVPQDGNGTLDVYEWHNGDISLISGGTDFAPSFFLGASSDGKDLFFGTHAKLTPQDVDNNGDLYDARVCTEAEPCFQSRVAEEVSQCEGATCQILPATPAFNTPASLSFSGFGNVSEPGEKAAKVPESRKQKLRDALRACKGMRKRRKRTSCEVKARLRYGKHTNTRKKTKRAIGRTIAERAKMVKVR